MKRAVRAWQTIKSSSNLRRLLWKPRSEAPREPLSTSNSTTPMMVSRMQPRSEDEGDLQDQPTIRQAIKQYAEQFLEACEGNILGNIASTIIRFAKTPGLPPYYQIKCYIILAASREEDTAEENVAAGKHYIAKAREALVRAREIYVHDPRDAVTLQALRKCIDEEWSALRAYEKSEVYVPEQHEDNWPLRS